jgi:transcriptional regulator with XRE-family HTH domain
MTSLRQALGTVIARKRKEKKLSQEEFAFRAKIHRTYMTGIERGDHNPSLDVMERISAALEVDLSDLVIEAETERRRKKH